MRTQTRFVLDAALAVAIVAAYKPEWTGISLHEWLSIAVIVPLLLHLFVNWDWALRILRTFIERLLHASRVNFVVDCLLMVASVAVMVSGFMVSGLFGIHTSSPLVWHLVHLWSANSTLALLGVHGALHWRWIASTAKRLAEPSAAARPARGRVAGTPVAARADADREITLEERRRQRRLRAEKKAAAERAAAFRAASLLGVTSAFVAAILVGVGMASPLLASAAQPKTVGKTAALQKCPRTGCTASQCHAAYGKSAAEFYHTATKKKATKHKAAKPTLVASTHKTTASSASKKAASTKVASASSAKKAAGKTAPVKRAATVTKAAPRKVAKKRTMTCPQTGCTASRCHGAAGVPASQFY